MELLIVNAGVADNWIGVFVVLEPLQVTEEAVQLLSSLQLLVFRHSGQEDLQQTSVSEVCRSASMSRVSEDQVTVNNLYKVRQPRHSAV